MPEVKYKPSFSEITGTPEKNSWVQVLIAKKEILDKGRLFFLLGIKSPNIEEISVVGKKLAQDFEETYIEAKENAFGSLKIALEKINNQDNQEVEIAAGVLVDNVLYLGVLGKAKILLTRGGKVVNLISGEEQITTVSGIVQDRDLLFFCTSHFAALLGNDKIHNALISFKTSDEIVSELAPQVMGVEDNSFSGCLVCQLSEELTQKSETETTGQEVKTSEGNETPIVSPEKKVNFINSIREKIALKIQSLRGGSDKVEFSFRKNKKRQALIIALILIALLASSVIFGLKKQEEEKLFAEFDKIYEEAKFKYDEGSAILELNNTQARNYLNDAKKELESKLVLIKNTKSSQYQKGTALLKQVNDALYSVGGVHKTSAPEVFYDLTLVKDDAVGNRLAVKGKTAAILDTKNNVIYRLALDSKAAEAVAGGNDVQGAKYVAVGTNIYFFTNDSIKEINMTNKRIKTVIKKDEDWGEIADLAAFAQNLYLLDKTNGQILKYVGTEDGFSSPRNYLVKDIKPDFSKSLSLTIDGSVWVLNSDNTVAKFVQGNPQNFNITGVEPPMTSPTKIFTSEDTKNIYFLESGKNRVVVLDKDGVYQGQYLWTGISPVTDLIALEDSKKILLVAGSKIYSLNLKN